MALACIATYMSKILSEKAVERKKTKKTIIIILGTARTHIGHLG